VRKLSTNLLALTTLSLMFADVAAAQGQVGITPPAGVPTTSINDVIRFVINVIFFIAVIAALIFLLIGGIKWLTSGGDKAAIEAARGQLIAAIIGLGIVIFGYFILNFVLTLIGIPNLTNLIVPTLGTPTQGPFP